MKKYKGKKWAYWSDYIVCNLKPDYQLEEYGFDYRINELGKEGWELVHVNVYDKIDTPVPAVTYFCIFKHRMK